MGIPELRWIIFKLAFLLPRLYASSAYYRKAEKRREFKEKILLFYEGFRQPERIKKIVMGVLELKGVRKVMRYLIPLMDTRYIDRFVEVKGLHYLDESLNAGKGVLLMAGHIGVPHLALNALRVMGYDLILISGVTPKAPKHPRIRYYDTHDNTIFVHDPSLSPIYKERILEALRSGKVVYYDADAGDGRRKERISFLGREMGFPTGMIHLAHQAEAAVIPFIHLYRRGKTTLIFEAPIEHHWEKGEGAYRGILTEFVGILESYIVNYPEQYLGIYGPTVLNYAYRSYAAGRREQGHDLEKR